MNYRALMRKKLLDEVYDKLSKEEKILFMRMSMEDKDHEEIMQALREIDKKTDSNHHSFTSDFVANVAGNAAWDSLVWLGSRLIKKL